MHYSVSWTDMHDACDHPWHSQGVTEQAYNKPRSVRHRQCCGGKRTSRGDMREFPSVLCTLRLLVIEDQALLLRRFHSTRNKAPNPLKSLMTGEPQAPLCQICCK